MEGLLANTKYTKESLEPIYYTYIHVRCDTDMPFYVGKGKGNRAYSKHSRSAYWKSVTNKTSFYVKIIYSNLIEEDAFIEEIKLIERYKDAGFPLVNHSKGGEGNTSPRSKEWRDNHAIKIKAAAARGAYKNRYNGDKNPFWNKKHTKETIEKIKLSKLKRKICQK